VYWAVRVYWAVVMMHTITTRCIQLDNDEIYSTYEQSNRVLFLAQSAVCSVSAGSVGAC
jgi:hypothetical protein